MKSGLLLRLYWVPYTGFLLHCSPIPNLYVTEQMPLADRDVIRITKNFQANGRKFRNNELCVVKELREETLTFLDGRTLTIVGKRLHIDQGIAVTSHASQGKTVDHVIASAPVEAFAQVNQAQLYVTMSRARQAMHLFTNSIDALREAVCRPSARLSPSELVADGNSIEFARKIETQTKQMELHAGKRVGERKQPIHITSHSYQQPVINHEPEIGMER
jgi:hypothetical protein